MGGVGSPWPALSTRPAAVLDGAWLDGQREGQGTRGVGEEQEKPGPLGPGVISGRGQEVGGDGLTTAGAESASGIRVRRRVAQREWERGGDRSMQVN